MIYGLSDLHLDDTKKKDMSIFGPRWQNYEEKIWKNWQEKISDGDTVLIPGDICWQMDLKTARVDLERLNALPGNKILLRGNHDYWWQSLNQLKQEGYTRLSFLQNNAFVVDGVRIVGVKGWDSPDREGFTDHDRKIYERELIRLRLSLQAKTGPYDRTIAMLHYPPFTKAQRLNDFGQTLREAGVELCVYGHLHGEGLRFVKEGDCDGLFCRCLSADYVDFVPQRLGGEYAGNRN